MFDLDMIETESVCDILNDSCYVYVKNKQTAPERSDQWKTIPEIKD